MTGRIPEETVQEVLRATDIVNVVSEYVQLKKQGRNFFGLCPFHGENTPSFSVSPEKQIYHCFGCGAGGNVFKFLMDIEGVSFQEAVQKLADKAGIELRVRFDRRAEDPALRERERMMEAHLFLQRFYHHLLVHTKEGQEALDYLQKRGFTKEIIEEFQIGYAPASRDAALTVLRKRGFPQDLLEKAGIIVKREEEDAYFDRFRGRIMFPIHDPGGNTVAFSGRSLSDAAPKYLNSPETKIFQKGRILFNFHRARPKIRKKGAAVLFEGFADCISAYRAGIDNGISVMGTSLTEEHVRLIRRNTDLVILCFDGDSAGKRAAVRAGEMLRQGGCQVRVAALPEGLDPDEYIARYGPEKFRRDVIENSLTLIAYKMQLFREGKNLADEGERARYIEEVQKELASLDSPVEQEIYLRQLADEFSLSLDALKENQRKIQRAKRRNQPLSPSRVPVPAEREKKLKPAHYNAERLLIAHMLRSRTIAAKVREKLAGQSFSVSEHQKIADCLYDFYENGNLPNLSHFLALLPDEGLQKLTAEIAMLPVKEEPEEQELNDYIKSVLNYQKLLKIKEKEREGKQAEREHNYRKAAEIAMEILQLRKSL